MPRHTAVDADAAVAAGDDGDGTVAMEGQQQKEKEEQQEVGEDRQEVGEEQQQQQSLPRAGGCAVGSGGMEAGVNQRGRRTNKHTR